MLHVPGIRVCAVTHRSIAVAPSSRARARDDDWAHSSASAALTSSRVPVVTLNLLMRRDGDANVIRSFVRSRHTYHTCFREAIAFTSVTFRRRVDPSHFRALATMSSFIDPVSDPSTMISRDARRSEKKKKESAQHVAYGHPAKQTC